MKNLWLPRLEQTDDGALGVLTIGGRLVDLFTLEPDALDPHKPQIPAGTYPVRRFHGKKYPDTYEIVVPGHTAVLFHWGNTEDDTQMCILLGNSPGELEGERAVLNSVFAWEQFMKFMNKDNGQITIVDCYPKIIGA